MLHRVAVAAVIVVALAVVAGVVYGVMRARTAAKEAPPETLVVIAESELEDGTKVAGLVAVLDLDAQDREAIRIEKVTPVDTLGSASIPGTSYDRLRDALALGGPELVARLSMAETEGAEADASEPSEATGWLLLDEDAWAGLVDAAGGAKVKLDGRTTVFTGERLFRFSAGDQTLTGEEAVALVRGSETLGGEAAGALARGALARELARAIAANASETAGLVESGGAESSEKPDVLTSVRPVTD